MFWKFLEPSCSYPCLHGSSPSMVNIFQEFQIGSLVEAFYSPEKAWFPAKVSNVLRGPTGTFYSCLFLFSTAQLYFSAEELKLLL